MNIDFGVNLCPVVLPPGRQAEFEASGSYFLLFTPEPGQ